MSDKYQLSSMLVRAAVMVSVELLQTVHTSVCSCPTRTPLIGAALFGALFKIKSKGPKLFLPKAKTRFYHLTKNETLGHKWVYACWAPFKGLDK